jgi:hypothetical protein
LALKLLLCHRCRQYCCHCHSYSKAYHDCYHSYDCYTYTTAQVKKEEEG